MIQENRKILNLASQLSSRFRDIEKHLEDLRKSLNVALITQETHKLLFILLQKKGIITNEQVEEVNTTVKSIVAEIVERRSSSTEEQSSEGDHPKRESSDLRITSSRIDPDSKQTVEE